MKPVAVISSLVLVAVELIVARPAHSFLPQGRGSGSSFTFSTWPALPVSWRINPSTTGTKIVVGNTSVTNVILNSFNTWTAAPNTSVSYLDAGTTTISSEDTPHNFNLICFVCNGSTVNFNNTDGTLALTLTSTSGNTIVAGDILFNPNPANVCFATDSTVTSCPSASDAVQDLQTVATHEIGHFFGLDHSAVAHAIMFPFAPPVLTTLSYDDVAGISLMYPKSSPDVQTSSISGTVRMAGASGVFGAHVFANSTTASSPFFAFPNIRKTPVGTLTFPNGTYTITGVPPDTYLVIAEPLDLPVSDADVSWAPEFNQATVQTGFTTRWH